MFIPTFALVSFLGSLFLLIFTLAYLYYLYFREREFEKKESRIYKEATKIVEQANAKAKQVIENAVERAKQILVGSEYLKQDLEADIDKAVTSILDKNIKKINEAADRFKESYDQLFSKLKEKYASNTTEILNEIRQEGQKEIVDFRQILRKETLDAQRFVGEKINQEFEKAKAEIGEYKKTELGKIDNSINRVVGKVLQSVTGKLISFRDHEDLITEALNQAKQDGAFDNL